MFFSRHKEKVDLFLMQLCQGSFYVTFLLKVNVITDITY